MDIPECSEMDCLHVPELYNAGILIPGYQHTWTQQAVYHYCQNNCTALSGPDRIPQG